MILINAQNSRTEKLGVFSRYVPLSIPVGIGSLAAYLIERGHNVQLWDDAVQMLEHKDIVELIRDAKAPYIFGISCLTASITRGINIARLIREVMPEAKIIFGGIHPTVLPEDVLNTGLADFVVRKEGEVPLEELYRALKNKENYESINSLSFRKNGNIIHNPALPGPDIDSLPSFPYHLFGKYRDKYDFGFVLGSRGCPYNCIFCSQRSITGRRFTYRSPEKVITDIDLLVNKYNRELITFMDDNMLTDKARINRLCALIVEKGLHRKASFQGQVRGDAIDDDILKSLKAANFITLDFGLETASERLMVIINKGETVKENIEALELAKKHGFKLSGTFILGLPTETRAERLMSYKLARQYLDYVRFNNATPYPGTKLYEIAKAEKRLDIGRDWENLNACGTLVQSPFSRRHLAYVPLGTSELELKADILKYNLFFYLRCNIILKLLDRKSGTAGWFKMPRGWYLDYKEWFYFIRLISRVIISWLGLFLLLVISYFTRLKTRRTPNNFN